MAVDRFFFSGTAMLGKEDLSLPKSLNIIAPFQQKQQYQFWLELYI